MARKDMARSAWTRVYSKKQIIRDFSCGEGRGKISLLRILKIEEPFRRCYEGREIVLADAGYFWLQLALDRSPAWFTVMFDRQGRLVQIYVDVTDGNEALTDNPSFEDMYLDFVVYGGRVYALDRDELDGALSAGLITQEQYKQTLREGERIRRELEMNTAQILAFFEEQFTLLRPELDKEERILCERARAESADDLRALFPEDAEERLQELREGLIDMYLVRCEGRPAGRLVANYTDRHLPGETAPGLRVCLSHFILFREYRCRGLGGRLLAFALEDLRARGYREFTVGVEAENRLARHLYEKQGFTELIGHGSVPCAYDLYLLRDEK